MPLLQSALLFFLLTPLALFAGQPNVTINAHFIKMQIEENGKKSNWHMVVDLYVMKRDGTARATWNSVFIMPDNQLMARRQSFAQIITAQRMVELRISSLKEIPYLLT